MGKNSVFLIMAVALTGAIALFSCSENDEPMKLNDGEVRFTSTIGKAIPFDNTSVSRAIGNVWSSGDRIGVFMVGNGTTDVILGAVNVPFITTGGTEGAFTSVANKIFYPAEDVAVNFIAYYPYKENSVGSGPTTDRIYNDIYMIDVATQSNPATIDLLWANATNGPTGYKMSTAGIIPLDFEHKLTKLILKTTADPSVESLTGMTVTINGMNTKQLFNLMSGLIYDEATDPTAVTMRTITSGEQYEAIILPQTVGATSNLTVEFTIGNVVYTWVVPPGTDFKSGEEHEWNITITEKYVSSNGVIRPWTTGAGGAGEASQ